MDDYVFDLSGGSLCLDFSNTVSERDSDSPDEHLHTYGDLVSWGRQAGVLTEAEARQLNATALCRSAEAEETLGKAIALREALYRIFAAVAADERPAAADLLILNRALARAMARSSVVPTATGFAWEWVDVPEALDRVLWPVARSAAELLTSSELDDVRECAADTCNWLFLDVSRNHSRRWCDMKSCGNRMKARRHYERKKAGS